VTARLALVALAALVMLPSRSRDLASQGAPGLEALTREHAALHARLDSAMGRDPLAARLFGGPSDLVLAIRPGVVTEVVAEVAHQYFDQVEIDLSAVRASASAEMRTKTFLGRVKLGDWQVEARVERLRGRLEAGHPRLRFHADRIDVEVPVTVRAAPGTIALAFAWDSSGLANVVCDDFGIERVLEGRVLEQQHVLSGAVHLSMGHRFLTATPVFEDRTVALKVDLTPDSWAAVEQELQAQDTLGRCGILLKPEVVLAELRKLAASGIKVRLPEALFRTVRLPAHLERQVTLGNRVVDLSLASAGLQVTPDLLWSTASLAAAAGPGDPVGRSAEVEASPGVE
jgi:hypothetical protein